MIAGAPNIALAEPGSRTPRGRVSAPREAHGGAGRDLDTINGIVAAATLSWNLPARVRRLALPSLLYNAVDLQHMSIARVDADTFGALGVALWEDTGDAGQAADKRAVLLHGLYIVPHYQRRGVGTRLLELVADWARARGFESIHARAWRESESFFIARGFTARAANGTADTYPRTLCASVRIAS
jgi:GNAT superfamily N-acetyltransferase